jgi:hypothetical protein
MLRFHLLLLSVFLILLPHSTMAQDVISVAHGPIFQKDIHQQHDHVDGMCLTISLLDTPESRQALEEYRAWDEAGRPGFAQKIAAQIQNNVGDRRSFKTYNFATTSYETHEFELIAIGELALIWVERSEFGEGKVTQPRVMELLESLDTSTPERSYNPNQGIFANNRAIFGPAPNVDGTGKVTILITNVKSEDNGLIIGGYFSSVNLSPTNANSNKADIIYINARVIHNPNRVVPIENALSTIAHEDQHLIHAKDGRLLTFQNEGQSEWAEVLNGYLPRAANNLQTATEVNIPLFTFRSGTVNATFDYSRAGLLHEYIAQRVGPEGIGIMSRSGNSGRSAYNFVLQEAGLRFPQFITDFHTANFLNNPNIANGVYSYSNPARSSTRTAGIAQEYSPVLISVNSTGSVNFGAAEITKWIGVEDFTITIDSPSDVHHRIIGNYFNSSNIEIRDLSSGTTTLSGEFESVSVISIKTELTGGTESNPTPSTYQYSASWDPLPVEVETLRYYSAAEFFAELPGDPSDASRMNIQKYATRFSPTVDGLVKQIRFAVNGNIQALKGSGDLNVSLHSVVTDGVESSNDAANGLVRYIPGPKLYEQRVDIRNLSSGMNVILIDQNLWNVNSNQDYFVVFEVINQSSDARVEFLIDSGSTTSSDTNYFPVRSRIFLGGATNRWARWGSSNNFIVDIQVSGTYSGPLVSPVFINNPEPNYTVVFGAPLEVNVMAEGTPQPTYIWTKNGLTYANPNGGRLKIDQVSTDDAGIYTVRATNFAGFTDIQQFEVDILPAEFQLAQNYPNPFNNSTRIKFSLAESGFVQMDVHDVMGRYVGRISFNRLYETGPHQIRFNASNLASGVYFYTIRFTPANQNGQSFSQTNKMMLVR